MIYIWLNHVPIIPYLDITMWCKIVSQDASITVSQQETTNLHHFGVFSCITDCFTLKCMVILIDSLNKVVDFEKVVIKTSKQHIRCFYRRQIADLCYICSLQNCIHSIHTQCRTFETSMKSSGDHYINAAKRIANEFILLKNVQNCFISVRIVFFSKIFHRHGRIRAPSGRSRPQANASEISIMHYGKLYTTFRLPARQE